MPHDVLADYLLRVESAVGKMENLFVEHYIEEILTPERANLRLRLRFTQGCLLEINEAIISRSHALRWNAASARCAVRHTARSAGKRGSLAARGNQNGLLKEGANHGERLQQRLSTRSNRWNKRRQQAGGPQFWAFVQQSGHLAAGR